MISSGWLLPNWTTRRFDDGREGAFIYPWLYWPVRHSDRLLVSPIAKTPTESLIVGVSLDVVLASGVTIESISVTQGDSVTYSGATQLSGRRRIKGTLSGGRRNKYEEISIALTLSNGDVEQIVCPVEVVR